MTQQNPFSYPSPLLRALSHSLPLLHFPPNQQLYLCERVYIRNETYLAMTLDRASNGLVIVASREGGMDIEEVAREKPNAIIKVCERASVSLIFPNSS